MISRVIRNRKTWIAACVVVVVLIVASVVAPRVWPFTRKKVANDLQQASAGRVEIRKFRKTFFPPGGVAEDVTIVPAGTERGVSKITIQRLAVRSSYTHLLSRRVELVFDGVQAHVSSLRSSGFQFSAQTRSNAKIDRVTVHDSVLQFSAGGKDGLPFQIHELTLQNPGKGSPIVFDMKVRNPEPAGEFHALGRFGPWRAEDPKQTNIEGMYSLDRANLGVFGGIGGMLSSQGSFQGTIETLRLQGSTDTPDFAVKRSGHTTHLVADYQAVVNATTGDVSLQDIHANFGNTKVDSHGEVAGARAKVANLYFVGKDGRIQDLLLMFIREPRSPVTGNVDFNATAELRSQHEPFLKEVVFTSDFAIDQGHFTKQETQHKMDHLSQEAQGEKQTEDPAAALSDLKGHVQLENGVATFSDLKFRVPGALARLHGTYDVLTEQINLHGLLLMEADLPHATSGIKSILLKPINIFLKKNRHGGARIPVTITGTYDHPILRTDPM